MSRTRLTKEVGLICSICDSKIMPDFIGWAGGHNAEPRKYYDEYGFDYDHFVHTTDSEEMDIDKVYSPEIDIEEWD